MKTTLVSKMTLFFDVREVQEKVTCLERQVQKQEREIVSLRFAISELIRTIQKWENVKDPTIVAPATLNLKHIRHPSNGSDSSGFRSRSSTPSSGHRVTFSPTVSNGEGLLGRPSSCLELDSPSPLSSPTSNLNGMKKWSFSQDLNTTPYKRINSGSLLNIHFRSQPIRHGTRDTIYNQDEGWIKVWIKGRSILLAVPSDHLEDYRLSKLNPAPLSRLGLEWVYGYRGKDCRSNLHWLPTGEMLYHTASVAILYNVDDNSQRHYAEHQDEIKCLAVHPNKMIVATGQSASLDRRDRRCRQLVIDVNSTDAGRWAQVRVWDAVSLHTIQVLGIGDLERSVCCVAFSQLNGGTLLAIVDDSPEHTLSLWDWQKGLKMSETKCSIGPILAAEFHNLDPYGLITAGRSHIHFWDTKNGALTKRIGIFERSTKPKFIHCVAFTDTGDLLTGDSSNQIMVWPKGSTRVSRVISTDHEGGVYSICLLKDGTIVTGGGKDGRIIHWDQGLLKTGREAKVSETSGGIRTLSQGRASRILVGTTKNCIFQGTFTFSFNLVVQGHGEDINVLVNHPSKQMFLTGSQDRHLYLWDSTNHSVLWQKNLIEVPKSACFSPEGSVLVIGTLRGRWLVLDSGSLSLIWSHMESVESVNHVSFSPDGHYLALASNDRCVYIYESADSYKRFNRVGRCVGHSGPVKILDWCQDNSHLQSIADDGELLFWNAKLCRQVTQMPILRDLQLADHACILGYNVFGTWPESREGADVVSCHTSPASQLLAAGYDNGLVKLFNYPANHPKCMSHSYNGHGNAVTHLRFLADSLRLLSAGGKDGSAIQWRVL